jgi:hypothetical protein
MNLILQAFPHYFECGTSFANLVCVSCCKGRFINLEIITGKKSEQI